MTLKFYFLKKNVPQFFHSQHTGVGVQAARKGSEGLLILAVKLSLYFTAPKLIFLIEEHRVRTGTELSGNVSAHLANSFVVM